MSQEPTACHQVTGQSTFLQNVNHCWSETMFFNIFCKQNFKKDYLHSPLWKILCRITFSSVRLKWEHLLYNFPNTNVHFGQSLVQFWSHLTRTPSSPCLKWYLHGCLLTANKNSSGLLFLTRLHNVRLFLFFTPQH